MIMNSSVKGSSTKFRMPNTTKRRCRAGTSLRNSGRSWNVGTSNMWLSIVQCRFHSSVLVRGTLHRQQHGRRRSSMFLFISAMR